MLVDSGGTLNPAQKRLMDALAKSLRIDNKRSDDYFPESLSKAIQKDGAVQKHTELSSPADRPGQDYLYIDCL